METKIIARVNNVDIVSTSDERELVPVKTVCDALGISYEEVLKEIENDDFVCSTMVLSTTVTDEGEEKKMCDIPLMYLIGWIFTDYVSRNTRPDSVMELHKALYGYWERRSAAQSARLKV